MKHTPSTLVVAIALACAGTASQAQTVPGNEAVRTRYGILYSQS